MLQAKRLIPPNFEHIIGSLAGDNTLLLIADSPDNVPKILNDFENMLHLGAKME